MDSKPLIVIHMTDDRAELFKRFCEFEPQFTAILESGMLNLRDAHIAIKKDENGKISTINLLKF